MQVVSIREARTRFPRIVAKAQAGEEVVITGSGKPVARLAGLSAAAVGQLRQLGLGKQHFTFPEHFARVPLHGPSKEEA